MRHKLDEEKKVARCLICRSEFSIDQLRDIKCCPNCGDTGQPLAIEDDVAITINWHELRILCSWAAKWCEHMAASDQSWTSDKRQAIYSIVGALQEQYPGFQPLGLVGELVKLNRSDSHHIH
jgi:hypothetical protein